MRVFECAGRGTASIQLIALADSQSSPGLSLMVGEVAGGDDPVIKGSLGS